MFELFIAFLSSFLFAFGLVISGMINPQKVIAFLDVTGNWDPSLMFVMVGAIGVNFVLFKLILKKTKPLLVDHFNLPNKKEIDRRLIIGATLFGIGWGMTGICPGPALANLFSGHEKIFIYLTGMILGMLLFEFYNFAVNAKK